MKELVLTLLLVAATSASWTSVTNPFKSMWLSLYSAADPSSSTATPAAPDDECRGCAQNRVQAELDQDPILTELRVEYVKQQILRKLRLEKPPEVSLSISTLPKPLVNGHVLELKPGEPLEPQIPAESFYGKTNQIVVFPDESIPYSKKCRQSSNHITGFNPAACFTFFLPNEMQFVSVTSAELWFYKEEDKNDSFNQTFVLSELDHWDQRGSFEKNTIMAIFETTIGEGWVKTDVSFAVRKWVEKQRLNHSIQVACSTCTIERNTAPVSTESTLKPFLVIQTTPLPQRYRPKRNSNCQADMKECCRDELYISFEDIGWSDWILHPSGYHAYFCRGSCSTAVSLTMSGSHHNDVIRRLLARGKALHRRNEIVPCCSPTQLSPIQLLYVDSNNTITQKTLPNMVVEACGCM
ncbi:growth/differentiation factor 8 isoform X1 [Phymastichus coffea]|uniref:growth/differentiation factor 8 isoform X1 n=1 Tax=Phymastichus coffea TaxID=108790 RepID=UPI00273B7E33|nr:growth/differentiation factor 8 isoform X1 [Phymastichus coffea]